MRVKHFPEPNSVIVMDNGPYHSVKSEKLPTTARKKGSISWIGQFKRNCCYNSVFKVELLQLTKKYINENPVTYTTDQIVSETGHTVLQYDTMSQLITKPF